MLLRGVRIDAAGGGPVGVAATLGAVQPLMVGLLAVPLLGQRLLGHRVTAGVTAVVGVGLLVLSSEAALDPVGIAAGLAATASMAAGVVLTQRWGRPVPLLETARRDGESAAFR